MLKAGDIAELVVHPVYPLVVNGKKVGRYTADFSYKENGNKVVEDVKPHKRHKKTGAMIPVTTAVFNLRRKVFEALYDIKLEVVR
jgi:hypothetical protein